MTPTRQEKNKKKNNTLCLIFARRWWWQWTLSHLVTWTHLGNSKAKPDAYHWRRHHSNPPSLLSTCSYQHTQIHTVHMHTNELEWLNLLALSIKGIRCSNTWCLSVLLQLAWKTDKTLSHKGAGEREGVRNEREKVISVREELTLKLCRLRGGTNYGAATAFMFR